MRGRQTKAVSRQGAPGWRAALAGSLLLLSAAAQGASQASATSSWLSCPIPSQASRFPDPLPHTAARVRAGGELLVVAVGSSSTAGTGASSPAATYPRVLQAELAARFPGARIRVVNRGVGGETYRGMLERFDRDVLSLHPDLVIWQLGTNAVIKDQGVAGDEPPIRAGVAKLKAAGADVILMNPQYAPVVLRDPDAFPMVRLLDDVGREERVPVFERFEVMRDWVVSGRATPTNVLAPDGLHMNDVGYRCVGVLLADAIANDVNGATKAPVATLNLRAHHR